MANVIQPIPMERRRSRRWSVDLNLEGWLELNDVEGAHIPLKFMNFGPGGIGVILYASTPPDSNHCGKLITQAHGGGCQSKPVCCRSLRAHPRDPGLWWAGYSFESDV